MDFSGIIPYSSESVSVPDTYYSLGEDCIVVKKYIPSHLESGCIKLSQDRLPTGEVVFLFENYFDGTLALISDDEDKLPDITVMIDHEEYEPAVNHGYLLVGGPFDADSKVILSRSPIAAPAAEAGENNISDIDSAKEDSISEDTETYNNGISIDENNISDSENIAVGCVSDTDNVNDNELSDEGIVVEDNLSNDEITDEDDLSDDDLTGENELSDDDLYDEDDLSDDDITDENNLDDDDISDEDDLSDDDITDENDLDDDDISDEDGLSDDDITDENDLDDDDISDEDGLSDDDITDENDLDDDDISDEDGLSDDDITDENNLDDDDISDEDGLSNDDVSDEDDLSDDASSGDSKNAASITYAPTYSHTYENASILYSEEKERYVLKIAEGTGAHAILPGGVEVFARSDGHAFKGYRMRIGEKEYDLVVMNVSELSEKARRCNAYMRTLGSFSGDCCYCIDIAHPEKNGTHGIRKGTSYIDSETGYKWGMTSPGNYEFELENGNYNVYTISKSPDGNTFSHKIVKKVSNGYLTLYSGNDIFTHISITAADAVISESSSYTWLTPDEKVTEAAYLYIPNEIPVQVSTSTISESIQETSVAEDTCVTNVVLEKAYKEPQFEHIDTGKSSDPADRNTVSPYVFETLEPAEAPAAIQEVPVAADRFSDGQNDSSDDSHVITGICATHTAEHTSGDVAAILATHTAEHTSGDVAAILATHTDAEVETIDKISDENSKAADSVGQISGQNTLSNNIRVSTYSVTVPAPNKQNTEHIKNTLKAKKARNAAAAAGIAAGAALLGGIIKALTGRKK